VVAVVAVPAIDARTKVAHLHVDARRVDGVHVVDHHITRGDALVDHPVLVQCRHPLQHLAKDLELHGGVHGGAAGLEEGPTDEGKVGEDGREGTHGGQFEKEARHAARVHRATEVLHQPRVPRQGPQRARLALGDGARIDDAAHRDASALPRAPEDLGKREAMGVWSDWSETVRRVGSGG
jgi:hypothetical protein